MTFYLGVPSLVLALWLAHAWWSWRRPDRFDPFGLLLLAGLPLAVVATAIAFGSTPERELSQYEALPRGEYGDLRVRLLILAAELVMAWFVVLALEGVLVAIREARRRRMRKAEPGSTPRTP